MAKQIMVFFAALLFVLTLLGTILFPRKAGYISGAILLLVALIGLGGFEWYREAVRKPYIIHGYLYSNNVTVPEAENLPAEEPLPIALSTGHRGYDIFLNTCRSCHSMSGYMSLSDKLAGLDEEHIANIIPRLHYFLGKMPPFPGNEDDAAELTAYLAERADPDPLTAHVSMSEEQKAEIVFHRRCGVCHNMTGYRPVAEVFQGLDYEEALETFEFLGDMADGMPPYTGDEEESRLLYNHLTGGGQ
jgi:mono/diheme cytochrome c family protein